MFQESLNSEITRKRYTYALSIFKNYYKIKDFDGIITIEKSELQKMVETYVIHVKKNVNPNSVPPYLTPIKTFLETNDIELNWRKIKRLYPNKIKSSGSSAYQTSDVKLMLEVTKQIRNKAIIHFFASTGVRAGVLSELKIRHIRDMPLGCKMVSVYENTREEYNTFLTPEASNALDLYLHERKSHGETLTEDSPLFRERYQLVGVRPRSITVNSISAVVRRSAKNASIRGQMKNGRYSEQLVHGFRKRFNTILKLNNEVNDNAIEKMMGHKNGLDGTYLQITTEQLFEEFRKGIADLTIADDERDKLKIQELESEKSELEHIQIKNLQYAKKLESDHEVITSLVNDMQDKSDRQIELIKMINELQKEVYELKKKK